MLIPVLGRKERKGVVGGEGTRLSEVQQIPACSRTFQRAKDMANLPQGSVFRIFQTCLAMEPSS